MSSETIKTNRFGTFGNMAVATAQSLIAVRTGNLGFAGEAIHNIGDSASFFGRWRASLLAEKDEEKSLIWQKRALGFFAVSAAFSVASGFYDLVTDHEETATPDTIGLALASALVNGSVAIMSHRSIKSSNGPHEHGHDHAHSHSDDSSAKNTLIHAFADLGAGFVYMLGLGAKYKGMLGGEIEPAVAMGIMGYIYAHAGIGMHKNIYPQPDSENTQEQGPAFMQYMPLQHFDPIPRSTD